VNVNSNAISSFSLILTYYFFEVPQNDFHYLPKTRTTAVPDSGVDDVANSMVQVNDLPLSATLTAREYSAITENLRSAISVTFRRDDASTAPSPNCHLTLMSLVHNPLVVQFARGANELVSMNDL